MLGRGIGIFANAKSKHLKALVKYSTAKKLSNLAQCELEALRGATKLRSMPYIATVDISSACQLSCPSCPTGAGIKGRRARLLDTKTLETFLSQAAPYLYIAHLYNWGEPFLNKDAPKIVHSFKEAGVFTSLSSHFSIQDFDRIAETCAAGLDHLIVSVDGSTAENYASYRRGGNFELVLENLRKLVTLRRTNPKISTSIEWQLIEFPHLKAAIPEARALARDIGVNMFRTIKPYENTPKATLGRCQSPWRNIVLQPDGGISACCKTFTQEDDFTHLTQGPLRHLRNKGRSLEARSLLTARKPPSEIDPSHPCLRCHVARSLPHLQHLASNTAAQTGMMGVPTQ